MLRLPPSNAARWVNCPGSVALEAPYPYGEKHPTTEEGIALHWATERVAMSWLPINDLEAKSIDQFLGQTCPENGVIITADMVWAGTVYLRSIWERSSPYLEGLKIEHQVSLSPSIEGSNGRVDAVWLSHDSRWLTILDLKYGFTPKSAFENWQLLCYAYAYCQSSDSIQNVEFQLIQPRGISAANPVKTWTVSRAELNHYFRRISEAARAVREAEARGVPARTVAGPHCRYCKHAALCDTNQQAGWEARAFAGNGVSVDLNEQQIAYELEEMGRAKELIRSRMDALEGLAIARIQAGKPIPGYGYGTSMGHRTWTIPDEEVFEMGKLCGVDLVETKAVSPNQAETVRKLPRPIIDRFTTKKTLPAKLTRRKHNESKGIFKDA